MPEQYEYGNKVAVVGTGMVGTSFAYALIQRSLATELVLIDADQARAEGEAMDLNHGLPFVRPLRISAGDYADLAGSRVVVIAAGVNQQPGQTRLDLLQKNATIFRDIIPRIVQAAPGATLVVATNPVDILTQIAHESANLPHGRVLGSGTILDTARFRYLLGEYYEVDSRSVHAYIVGEHGDSELPLWSLANIAGVRLREYVSHTGHTYDPATMESIFAQVRDAAYEIIKRKRATYYAIGLGLLTIVEAILRNQRTVLTVSSPMTGQYGVSGIALSLPTILGQTGAEEVLNLTISQEEQMAFQHSAAILQDNYRQIDAH